MAKAPSSSIPDIYITRIHNPDDIPSHDRWVVNKIRALGSWYTKGLVGSAAFRKAMNVLPSIDQQMQAVNEFFIRQAEENDTLKYVQEEALAA